MINYFHEIHHYHSPIFAIDIRVSLDSYIRFWNVLPLFEWVFIILITSISSTYLQWWSRNAHPHTFLSSARRSTCAYPMVHTWWLLRGGRLCLRWWVGVSLYTHLSASTSKGPATYIIILRYIHPWNHIVGRICTGVKLLLHLSL